jgi:hypothetical protein
VPGAGLLGATVLAISALGGPAAADRPGALAPPGAGDHETRGAPPRRWGLAMTERAVVDRIVEGRQAVLLVGEGEVERVVPVERLPAGAREGAWLRVRFEAGELVEAEVDQDQTEQTRRRIEEKLERLRRRGRPPA